MKLRKNRPHQQGAANKDFRAQPIQRPEEVPTIEFLATAKSNKFSEIIQEKAQRIAPDPLKETVQFYKENDKQIKFNTEVANTRFAQLEEKELRKRVFVGDSNTTYERAQDKKKTKKSKSIQEEEEQTKEKLSNFKHEDYSKQIQETQLVGIKHNVESLEGQVDLKKVKEVRRALRRRYANRKNFQKIYNSWDSDSLGKITVKNAYDMIKKLGIKVNLNEARVLVASVDQDLSGTMGLDEFMDLIFTDSDTLDVDLTKIPSLDIEKIKSGELQEQAGEMLANESKNIRNNRHKNQITMILKNKNKNLATLFRNADEFNCGFVTQEKLNEILHKQNIPDTIMDPHDKNWVFDQFKFEDYKFNYKDFVNFLNDFQFKPEDAYVDPKETNLQKTQVQRSIDKYKEKEDQQIHIYQVQKVNPWHFEKIRNDYRKVSRIMFRYLEKQDDFEKLFMDTYKVKDKNDLENMNINKKQLTQFIQNMFIHVGEKDVKKAEVENFLSAFQYNKHGYTKFNDIPKVIYSETDSQWYEKMQRDVHYPPPPNDIKYHPDFPIEELQELQKDQQKDLTKSDGFQQNNNFSKTDDISHLKQPPIDNRRTQTVYKNGSIHRNTYTNFGNSTAGGFGNGDLLENGMGNILQKLENRIFCGTKNSYDIFKQFDKDKDGYVSHNDFVNHLQEMAILNKNEIKQLLVYIDPEQKGHMNFREFSDKIRDGVQYTDKLGNQTYITSIQPSKEYNDSISGMLPYIQDKVNTMKKPYYPKAELNAASRFKFTPSAKNTFYSFRPDHSCPGFQSEKERFNQSHNHRTDWQKQELTKFKSYEQGRIQQKRTYQQNIECQKNKKEELYWEREQNKRTTKGVLQWTYEHRAHLQNNWNGGGKSQLEEVRAEKEQAKIKPPLFGKWQKN